MKNKKWLRSVAFILLLCVAVAGVMHCYSQPKYFNTRFINTFDEMPDNTDFGLVMLSDENASRTENIFESILSGGKPQGNLTGGLYRKGLQEII